MAKLSQVVRGYMMMEVCLGFRRLNNWELGRDDDDGSEGTYILKYEESGDVR
jgi:hypothetical protein